MLPALAFLANPSFWAGVSKVLPAAASALSGDQGQQQGQPAQQQPLFQPQQQAMQAPQIAPFRQNPSYGQIINDALKSIRGF